MGETLQPGPDDVGVAVPPPPPAQEVERSEEQILRETVYAEMAERSVYPVKLIQGATVIDLIAEDSGAVRKRPFMVFEVAVPDRIVQSAIYKVRVEDDPKQQARCEIAFFKELVESLRTQMSPEMAQRIKLPKLFEADDEATRPYLMEEQFSGKICGGVHEADTAVMGEQDFRDMADFIKFYQQVAAKTFQTKEVPVGVPNKSAMGEYRRLVAKWGNGIHETLGGEYYDKLVALLDENEEMIESSPDVFLLGDVHPANVIKTEEGSLGLFDFEGFATMKAPGQDYCFLYADLWVDPEKQAKFLEYVCKSNEDIPNFKRHLRLNYLSFRGVGELNDSVNKLHEAKTEQEKAKYTQAVRVHAATVKAAIDGSGIWSEETN